MRFEETFEVQQVREMGEGREMEGRKDTKSSSPKREMEWRKNTKREMEGRKERGKPPPQK